MTARTGRSLLQQDTQEADHQHNRRSMKTELETASPLQAEKDFRAFLRKQELLLKSMKLCDAWPAVLGFYRESVNKYSVLTPEGEGLTFDAHLGTADRGVRFEVAINRLFRLPPEDASAGRWPAVRLSLRLQYTLDMIGAQYLNRHQAYGVGQAFVSWSDTSVNEFVQQVEASDAFITFRQATPIEVRLSADPCSYSRLEPALDPTRGLWWGVFGT